MAIPQVGDFLVEFDDDGARLYHVGWFLDGSVARMEAVQTQTVFETTYHTNLVNPGSKEKAEALVNQINAWHAHFTDKRRAAHDGYRAMTRALIEKATDGYYRD